MTTPITEVGYASGGTGWWAYDTEQTPELRWPFSVRIYDAMRRQDAQSASVLRAVTLPVRRTSWRIDGAGCRPEVAQHIAQDMGLEIVGQGPIPVPRTRDRFSWAEHLQLALTMTAFGHSIFEQVYRIDDSGAARLRKLAWRPPQTIAAWNVADDGGLASIEQWGSRQPIPISRLVAYSHDREGAAWWGNSLLRPAYKHWLIKDRLLRTQAQTIDRNGMGIPLYTAADDEEDLVKGEQLATAWRSGDAAGAAIPNGASLELVGVKGTLPDAGAAIQYHDEQIARAVLAHFLNLGTQTGSWALGSTFADFFTLSLQSLGEAIRDTAQQHIIEDLVDVNWGPDEPAPRLVFEEIGSRQAATAQALKLLVDAGILYPDRSMEEAMRQQMGLPPKAAGTP